jgi:predicted dehydrogenase
MLQLTVMRHAGGNRIEITYPGETTLTDPNAEGKYRVGAIGIGRKGAQHARAYRIHPLTRIVAAADTDEENLEIFCRRFNIPGYADHREMLEKEEIDIAAPILPVQPNPDVVMDCAEAGVKAILCEKPIAARLQDADRMVAACKSRGIKFGSGDLDVNLPDHGKARGMIDSGEFGDVKSITFYGGSGTEMSGGGCQLFSLMRFYAGSVDVSWMTGWVANDAWSDYDQGGAGYVRFVNGVEGFIHRESDSRTGLEVALTGGVIRYANTMVSMWKADGSGGYEKVDAGFRETPMRTSASYEPDGWKWPGDRNLASVGGTVDALENDTEPIGSGDNGRRVLEMAIAIRESHRQGHAPVRLPLEDRSLRMIPSPSRWQYKKPQIGREAYMTQIAAQVKD